MTEFERGLRHAAMVCYQAERLSARINRAYQKDRLPGYCLGPDGFDCARLIREEIAAKQAD
jgi:hypothetical protein